MVFAQMVAVSSEDCGNDDYFLSDSNSFLMSCLRDTTVTETLVLSAYLPLCAVPCLSPLLRSEATWIESSPLPGLHLSAHSHHPLFADF